MTEIEPPTLRPLPGFNWHAVSWGGPDEPQAETCSYCEAPIDEDSVPLILWNEEGWCARFCDDCQRTWWGLESVGDDDDAPDDDPPSLGPCCICEAETGARTIVMLPVKGVIPGHGWGCVVCGLPPDGASAVVCGECSPKLWSESKPLRFACRGYPATEGRVPIEKLTEPHEHDLTVEH